MILPENIHETLERAWREVLAGKRQRRSGQTHDALAAQQRSLALLFLFGHFVQHALQLLQAASCEGSVQNVVNVQMQDRVLRLVLFALLAKQLDSLLIVFDRGVREHHHGFLEAVLQCIERRGNPFQIVLHSIILLFIEKHFVYFEKTMLVKALRALTTTEKGMLCKNRGGESREFDSGDFHIVDFG